MHMWEPLLSGDLHRAARERIAEIATHHEQTSIHDEVSPWALCQNALFYIYLSKIHKPSDWKEQAIRSLNLAIESFSEGVQLRGADLSVGWAGVGWIVEHINRALENVEGGEAAGPPELNQEDDPAEAIDRLILDLLQKDSWSNLPDLISRSVGVGLYFLERLPRARAVQGIVLVLDQIEKHSDVTAIKTYWKVDTKVIAEQWYLGRTRIYNLGAAYGIAGLVHFLSETSAAGIERERIASLLNIAAHWLMAHQQTRSISSPYLRWFAPDQEYSDMGVGMVLYQAGCRAENELWRKFGVSLLDSNLSWKDNDGDSLDGSLLRGAIGVAHVYNRLYQRSQDKRYKQAAIDLFDRGLTLTTSEAPVGRRFSLSTNNLLLNGPIGIALSLVSATSAAAPDWDRLLLLSGW